jgi:hypothetical protein
MDAPPECKWIANFGDFAHNPCDREDRRDESQLIRGSDARSNSVPLKDNAEATS